MAAVVDAIGQPAHLFGHSYGALCALEAALRTDQVRKLVLYDPPIPIPPGSALVAPETLEEMETLLAAGDREGVVLYFAREVAQLPEEMITAFRSMPEWQSVIAIAHTVVYEVRAVNEYVFDPERFRNLKTPTLLLLGSESPQFLTTATESVDAALPQGRLLVLSGQGHLAMDTDPDLFLREVVSFLTEEPNAVVADSGSFAARRS